MSIHKTYFLKHKYVPRSLFHSNIDHKLLPRLLWRRPAIHRLLPRHGIYRTSHKHFLQSQPRLQLCLADHRMFWMRWFERGFLLFELLLEFGISGRRGNEPKERRGRIQWARAELWVSLQTDKVGVV